MNNEVHCTICGRLVEAGGLTSFDGEYLCPSCLDEQTVICDRCGDRIWSNDAESDSHRSICQACYNRFYFHCADCDHLIHEESE